MEEEITEEKVGYSVHLEKFDGPLDLLLHLIKEAKVDIKEVFVSKITEQFLDYISDMSSYPAETIAEFIEVASTLVQIKSKKLLPVQQEVSEDEEDPEQKLIRQLEEYKIFKEQAEKLSKLEDTNKFFRAPDKSVNNVHYELKDLNYDSLLDALAKVVQQIDSTPEPIAPKEIQKDRFTVATKIAEIKDRLMSENRIMFSSLYDKDYSKSEVINTFLALLELLKVQEIKVTQIESLGEIIIEKQTGEKDG